MKNRTIFVWSIILLAVNMRIPITAVSSLIPALQKQLGLSTSAAG
ncbi:MFS transporter [Lacticaseibacillus thailandensis]|nr:MFS transporter [Lacticaseibacillus thailandensis]